MKMDLKLTLILIWLLTLGQLALVDSELNLNFLELVKQKNTEDLDAYIEQGVDVNFQDRDGKTALMYATLNNDISLVNFLLDHGAKMSLKDQTKMTAYFYAYQNGYSELVFLLATEYKKRIKEINLTFNMEWEYIDSLDSPPNTKHIRLTFIDFPNYHIGIYSNELGKYLESRDSSKVNVEFCVKYDMDADQVGSYMQKKIGSLTSWQSSGGYGGRQGQVGNMPSPWDQVESNGKIESHVYGC